MSVTVDSHCTPGFPAVFLNAKAVELGPPGKRSVHNGRGLRRALLAVKGTLIIVKLIEKEE